MHTVTRFSFVSLLFHLVTYVHSHAYLYCDEGQVIYIYGADYGRRDKTTCASGRPWLQIQNVNCSNSTTKVAESCNGKNSCEIFVSDQVLGDHCTGTDKYLEVAYICQYAGPHSHGLQEGLWAAVRALLILMSNLIKFTKS
ncbi:L-rhamnose-binding lectin SML-like [Cheilinus undulatus]|uniref:L-rhamnose-binding lectin SML-like n=1 Tax=Cheilinus undulatus TaxID=241271 RepID=UPI001BD423E7|nr:L-rhamnose-binding lectin SML-like [Cheilinus undulatus]